MSEANTIWMKVWTPAGYSASVTLGFEEGKLPKAEEVERMLLGAGWLSHAPDLAEGQKAEKVVAVMRRVASNGAPVVDFYPEWNEAGTYGINRCGFMYLDKPEDVAEFEAQSGLKLMDIPLYESEAALKRKFGKTHPKQVAVATPFEIIKTPDGQHDNGMPRYIYSYKLPKLAAASAAPAAPKAAAPAAPKTEAPTAPKAEAGEGAAQQQREIFSGDGMATPSPDEDWTQNPQTVATIVAWGKAKSYFADEAELWTLLGGDKQAARKRHATPRSACLALATPF